MQNSDAVDEFITQLLLSAKDCDYPDKDEMIRDRIVFGTNLGRIREKLINEGLKLTLDKAIQIAQSFEYSQKQLNSMAEQDVHSVKTNGPMWNNRNNRGNRQPIGKQKSNDNEHRHNTKSCSNLRRTLVQSDL